MANDLIAEVAALKNEVKWLKWIIPSASGLVALLVLIFWGIERGEIGENVKKALNEEGVKIAVLTTKKAQKEATAELGKIIDIRDKSENELKQWTDKFVALEQIFLTNPKWPHAINCGENMNALYILTAHDSSTGKKEGAIYTQTFQKSNKQNVFNHVKFNHDGAHRNKVGGTSKGCGDKSIDQLRKEGRTYHFISE